MTAPRDPDAREARVSNITAFTAGIAYTINLLKASSGVGPLAAKVRALQRELDIASQQDPADAIVDQAA